VRFQLRVYIVKAGAMDAFVREWHEHVRPLRLSHGFSVLGPWTGDDGETFVWILGHDEDFEAADEAYYTSEERRAVDPDPARHLAETRTWFMQSPLPAPAQGR
jgi:NIPSNAP protein